VVRSRLLPGEVEMRQPSRPIRHAGHARRVRDARRVCVRAALPALLLAGAVAAGAGSVVATAQVTADAPADRHADKSKLICIGEDGQEKIIEGTGTLAKR